MQKELSDKLIDELSYNAKNSVLQMRKYNIDAALEIDQAVADKYDDNKLALNLYEGLVTAHSKYQHTRMECDFNIKYEPVENPTLL